MGVILDATAALYLFLINGFKCQFEELERALWRSRMSHITVIHVVLVFPS